jgi:chromate transporter
MLLYFLRLGALGFGGPIALVGYMEQDLVERRRWFSKQDYLEGLTLAQLAPGPLAAQLAIYLGWVRGQVVGATLTGLAFIAPSFLMVMVLAVLYIHYGGLPWMQKAFYGVGAAVIALIIRSAYKLTGITLGRDYLLWALFAGTAVVTALTGAEIIWIFLAAGAITLAVKAPPHWGRKPPGAMLAAVGPLLLTGLHGPASPSTLWQIFRYFAEAGAFIFGSGLAIVPFLHSGVVDKFGWLNERQFLDAVAVAMITPGPVVITVGFIGYLVAGVAGASLAALGVFLPCYLFVVVPAPYYRRYAGNPRIKAFIQGITAAAVGAIAGAVFILGHHAVTDIPTVLICLVTLGVILGFKQVPDPLIIVLAGLAGLAIKG